MFVFLKKKKKDFLDTARTVIYCQNNFFASIFQQHPYSLVFKTTNYCWNNCAHCAESSGVHNPRNFIPESVITGYIDQAIKDKKFSKEIVFTGGEIMSAYKFAPQNYVPNIINHALNAGCGVDIKTNAGWVNFPWASEIFSDIKKTVRNQNEYNDSGIKRIVKFQVSLSLDRFHKDAFERDFKFIEHFAHTNIPGTAFTVHVSSFKQDRYMFNELMKKLAQSGIKVNEMFLFDSDMNAKEKLYDLNGNVMLRYSEGTLFNGGRAKDIKSAYKTPFPQFVFLSGIPWASLVAFDSFGNVTLGENSGKKITVPWCDQKSEQSMPLQKVQENLVDAIKAEEQDFLNQHKKMDAYFKWARRVCR